MLLVSSIWIWFKMDQRTKAVWRRPPRAQGKEGSATEGFWSVLIWLNSLHSEVICCQSGVVILQDDVGIVGSCRDYLMSEEVGKR